MKKKTLFETLEEANSTSQQLDKKKLNKLLEDINPTEQRPTNVNTEESLFTSLERNQDKSGGDS